MSKVNKLLEVELTIVVMVSLIEGLVDPVFVSLGDFMTLLVSKISEGNSKFVTIDFTTMVSINHIKDLMKIWSTIWSVVIWSSISFWSTFSVVIFCIITTVMSDKSVSEVSKFTKVEATIMIVIGFVPGFFNPVSVLLGDLMTSLVCILSKSINKLVMVNLTTSININLIEDLLEIVLWCITSTTCILHELVGKINKFLKVELVVSVMVSNLPCFTEPLFISFSDLVAFRFSVLSEGIDEFIFINFTAVVSINMIEDCLEMVVLTISCCVLSGKLLKAGSSSNSNHSCEREEFHCR